MINNLCKHVLENGGIVQNLLIDSKDSEGLGLTNPSVYNLDGKLIVNVRHVQYCLYHSENKQKYQNQWGPLVYIHPEDDTTLRTRNYLANVDLDTLKIKDYQLVDTTKLDVKPLWEFIGLEDARLAYWDNKLYMCGVRRDTTTNGEGRMELSEIVDGKEVNRHRIQPPSGPSYCEKNWMPVIDMPYHFVKWTSTTEVVKVNITNGTSETVVLKEQSIKFPRDIRGGSQVIPYKDYRIAITHEVDLWHNEQSRKDAQYYHRIVVWDKDWNIVSISDEFKFMTGMIEFSCGLAYIDNAFVVTFGFQDTTAFIMKIPENVLLNLVGIDCKVNTIFNNTTDKFVNEFVMSPYDDGASMRFAIYFGASNQLASAISFYLRTAEYSENTRKVYDSLIEIGKCFNKLGRRTMSELQSYMNALYLDPEKPDAYYYISTIYERRQDWQNCYLYANFGLERYEKNPGYLDKYLFIFQKAVSSWWWGRGMESRELFHLLVDEYWEQMDEAHQKSVEDNVTRLGCGPESQAFHTYTKEEHSKLRYKFVNSNIIERNYSQVYQDMFILSMLNGKKNGTYLEIGAAEPFKGSNTALLEKDFNWTGVSIEYDIKFIENYKANRSSKLLHTDALTVDYKKLLEENFEGNTIDYLQLDIEPAKNTYDCMLKIPFDEYKFAVITYEHDYYVDVTKSFRDISRKFLLSKGYVLVVNDISPDGKSNFEDWWIHPDLIDSSIFKRMQMNDNTIHHCKEYIFSKYEEEPVDFDEFESEPKSSYWILDSRYSFLMPSKL